MSVLCVLSILVCFPCLCLCVRAYEIFTHGRYSLTFLQVRVKQEMAKEELRVKSTAMKVDDIDYVAESQQLLNAIAKYK